MPDNTTENFQGLDVPNWENHNLNYDDMWTSEQSDNTNNLMQEKTFSPVVSHDLK